MSRFVRASKVRHVYADKPKEDVQFHVQARLSSATGDHNYIKANATYFAIPLAIGGGSLAVHNLDSPGRLDIQPPVIDGHKGPILDFDFNPFHEGLIATGGDDCLVKVWGIDEGGMKKTLSAGDELVQLNEHQRKITVLRFHPTADMVLASGSADHTVKIWDVEKQAQKSSIEHGELIQDVIWNYEGSKLVTSAKDKKMRIIDPHNGEVIADVQAHEGAKTSKLVWLSKQEKLVSVGFTRQSKRQFKIWDPRKLSKEITTKDIDQGSGVIMPFYDEDTNLLMLGGKGDGNIRYYEVVGEDPWAWKVSEFNHTPIKGLAMCPKRAVDVNKCELIKMLKLTSNSVDPLSFICPRKSDLFQKDLYPDCYAGESSISADDFFGGKDGKIKLRTMDPSKAPGGKKGGGGVGLTKKKPYDELEREVNKLEKYNAKLIKALEKANITVPEP
mmetsp:Transcript_7529/g.17092  ORF Transcript_7529/g.17092 Transcript_7529/m.17092 type:complete len:444 (-) Transcript_7529:1-1332(-)